MGFESEQVYNVVLKGLGRSIYVDRQVSAIMKILNRSHRIPPFDLVLSLGKLHDIVNSVWRSWPWKRSSIYVEG